MTLSAATLMTTVGGGSVPVPLAVAPAPVALVSFKADAPTEYWRTDVPRRPVTNPAPTQPQAVAKPAVPPAVTQPAREPLAAHKPAVTKPVAKQAPVVKRAAARAPVDAASGTVSCRAPWLSGVKRVAQVVGCDLSNRFGVSDIGGYRAGSKEHGSGKALDLMVGRDRAKGDAIVEYVLANWDALGVRHVIWQQRINYGSGWKAMEDRGSATANHRDHPHLYLK